MRTVLIFIGLLCLMPALSSGDPPPDPALTERPRLREELRRLEQTHGSSHPQVLAVKAHLEELHEPAFKGPVLLRTRPQDSVFTLRDLRAVVLGGRQFLVGEDVKSDYTRGTFVGKRIWIPIDDVTQMVELGE